jgi:glycosyltransferase involved in cell wall biosynthesis
MRIAFLTSLFMPFLGGAEIFLHHLVKDMAGRGHHVAVIAPGSRKHRNAFEMTYPYVRAPRARSKRYMVGNALPSLLFAHLLHKFDLVHCQGEYHEATAAYYFKKITGVPYVCRPVGGGFTNIENYPKLQKKLYKSLDNAALMIAQCNFLRNRIQNYGIPDTKIVTINNGVRIDEVRHRKLQEPRVLPPYLLYAGGLKSVKGYDIAVKAFSRIANRYPELKLVVIGLGQKKQDFDALIDQLGFNERIKYLHYCDRDATMALFCHAEIYLCPFRRSPFSNANLEALAAGIPIIATAVEGNLEQIRDGVEGFLIPPDDADAMAMKIERILDDPDLHNRLSTNARKKSHQFKWKRMVDKYENCYKSVLK